MQFKTATDVLKQVSSRWEALGTQNKSLLNGQTSFDSSCLFCRCREYFLCIKVFTQFQFNDKFSLS